MITPIADYIDRYRSQKRRFHMPGHKGTVNLDDITEIDGADVLYAPSGIILQSENIASEIFGSGRTVYSVEGSSLCIRATVYLLKIYAESINKSPVLLAVRNAHSSFVSACALADVEPIWLNGAVRGAVGAKIDIDELDKALERTSAVAFYLTSPDYIGNIADVKAVSAVCKKHNALLVTDNAHGAYLKFLSTSLHPIDLGADIAIDSAHKTLPCLTGTAYLHIAKTAPEFFKENADNAMRLFASTSPSYLLMRSLDEFNATADSYRKDVARTVNAVNELKARLKSADFALVGDEPLKITVSTKTYGYLGTEIAKILMDDGIHPEFCDKDYLTLMFTPCNSTEDICALGDLLTSIKKLPPITELPPIIERGLRVTSIRQAVFSPSETIPTIKAEGRICGALTCSCPPAVPIAVCGEIITKSTITALLYYGNDTIKVVK